MNNTEFQLTEVTERERLTLFTTCKWYLKKITRGYSGWGMGREEKERGKKKKYKKKKWDSKSNNEEHNKRSFRLI